MALDYLDAKTQLYIPAALIIVGCAITKPAWLPFAVMLAAALISLKIKQHSLSRCGNHLLMYRASKSTQTGYIARIRARGENNCFS